jgi:hypothetical protein
MRGSFRRERECADLELSGNSVIDLTKREVGNAKQ